MCRNPFPFKKPWAFCFTNRRDRSFRVWGQCGRKHANPEEPREGCPGRFSKSRLGKMPSMCGKRCWNPARVSDVTSAHLAKFQPWLIKTNPIARRKNILRKVVFVWLYVNPLLHILRYSKSSESQAGDRAEIESERDMGSTLKQI